MMRPNLRLLTQILGLTLVITGCAVGSPTVKHLQLNAQTPEVQDRGGPDVYVDAITIPDYLLRTELMLRNNDYSLSYDASQRWAEPLDIGLQRLIKQQLKAGLGTYAVGAYPDPVSENTQWRLNLDIRRFEAMGMQAVLEADGHWEHLTDPAQPIHRIGFSEQITLQTRDGEEIAAALSELVTQLTSELANALTTP